MSREEVAAHLRNLQLSLDGLQRGLEGRIGALPDTRAELPAVLASLRRQLQRFLAEQVAELEAFAEEAGWELEGGAAAAAADADGAAAAAGMAASPASSAGQGTPLGAQLRSLQDRMARMGGTPALGACVLPRPVAQPALNTTASPAAVEIMKGRLGGTDADATPLRRTGSGVGADKPSAPLVQLRATPVPAPGKAAASPLGAAPPNSELAAAIQRRMQRLASASPEKEAVAAAAAEAAA